MNDRRGEQKFLIQIAAIRGFLIISFLLLFISKFIPLNFSPLYSPGSYSVALIILALSIFLISVFIHRKTREIKNLDLSTVVLKSNGAFQIHEIPFNEEDILSRLQRLNIRFTTAKILKTAAIVDQPQTELTLILLTRSTYNGAGWTTHLWTELLWAVKNKRVWPAEKLYQITMPPFNFGGIIIALLLILFPLSYGAYFFSPEEMRNTVAQIIGFGWLCALILLLAIKSVYAF